MLEYWTWISFAIAALLCAALLGVAHWFPYPEKLTRIQAYVIGCGCILIGFSLWRLLNGDWLTPAGLLAILMVAGATVRGCYWIDDVILHIKQARRAEGHDDDLI